MADRRNLGFDILRLVGIVCIVLAHVEPPGAIYQLRNFDVPLLVVLSGVSYSEYTSKHSTPYTYYVWSRFMRLVLPLWSFLVVYFAVYSAAGKLDLTFYDMMLSFVLMDVRGVGIWIIRVFLGMALIAPLLFVLNKKIDTNVKFSVTMFVIYFIYVLLLKVCKAYFSWHQVDKVVLIFIPYALLFLYGIRLSALQKNVRLAHVILCSLLFCVFLLYYYLTTGQIMSTQLFKKPPRLYYLSYAMFCSLFLYSLKDKFSSLSLVKQGQPFISFVGGGTLWIYLWHWFFLKALSLFTVNVNWFIGFVFVFIASVVTVYAQSKIVYFVCSKLPREEKNIRRIFIG